MSSKVSVDKPLRLITCRFVENLLSYPRFLGAVGALTSQVRGPVEVPLEASRLVESTRKPVGVRRGRGPLGGMA